MKHSEVIAQLRTRLREMERAQRKNTDLPCSTGTPLDQLLPAGGIEWGTLIEWLAQGEGTGMATLALIVSSHLLAHQGFMVVLDTRGEFYPAAVAGLGMTLERMVIVRPDNRRDELWAWEQALRSPAVTVVLGWIEGVKEGEFRRLQLAVETGGGVGFLLRSHFFRRDPSWAETRLLVEARPMPRRGAAQASSKRRMRIEVLRARGEAGGALELEMSHEEIHVRVVSALADPASASRSAGA